MALRYCFFAMFAAAFSTAAVGSAFCADDVQYIEENGVTYRVTRSTVQRSVPRTHYEEVQHTQYHDRYTTEMQPVPRTYHTPVTEYRWEARWHGRFNPFAQPYMAYHYVPRTRWEMRSETVHVPVSRHETVPEQVTMRTPVTRWETVEEQVTRRVAVGPSPSGGSQAASIASRPIVVGGVSRLDGGDPPRQGAATMRR